MGESVTFRILHRDQRWSGLYTVEDGEVRVDSAYGSGRMKLGRRRPGNVAGEILFGLVDDWCRVPRARLLPGDIARLTEVLKFKAD